MQTPKQRKSNNLKTGNVEQKRTFRLQELKNLYSKL